MLRLSRRLKLTHLTLVQMIDKLLWITLRSSIDEILVLIIAQVQRCLKLLSLEDLIRDGIQRSLIALNNAQVGI